MAINRFNQLQQPAGFQPLSFQELAFAPITLRQREDAIMNQQDEILQQMNNIQVYDQYQDEANQIKDDFRNELNQLATNIQEQGAGNINFINDFRNLRNKYNQSVSNSGALGMASNLRSNLDKERQNYFAMGLENGQSPADIERNWNAEVQKYQSQLPSTLKELQGGSLPALNPSIPPKSQDIANRAKELFGMLGAVEDSFGQPRFEPVTDQYGVVTGYRVFNQAGTEITNEPNVAALTNFMKTEVLDPNSALHQDLLYKGYTPEDFVGRIDSLAEVMKKTSSAEKTTYQTTTGQSGDSGQTRNASTSSSPGSGISLIPTNNASEKIDNTDTKETILKQIEGIAADDSIPENEKEMQLTALRQSYKHKERMENTEAFKESMNRQIQLNPTFRKYNITSVDELNDIANRTNSLWHDKKSETTSFTTTSGQTRYNTNVEPSKYEEMKAEYDKMYGDVMRPLLANSELYTLDMSGASDKLSQTLSKTLPTEQLKSLAASGQIDMSDGNIMPTFTQLDPEEDGFEEFMQLVDSPDTKFSLKAMDSGNIISGPSLVYQGKYKDGDETKTFDFSIELKDDAFSQSLLSRDKDFYKALDPQGKLTVDKMRDNISYAGLATDMDGVNNTLNPNTLFESTNNVVNFANRRNRELFGTMPSTLNDPRGIDKLMADSMFVKNDGSQYGVTVNDDGSYSTYKTSPDNPNRMLHYSLGDHFEKEVVSDYINFNHRRNPNKFTAEYLNTAEGKVAKENAIMQKMRKMLATSDPDNPVGTLPVYNNSATFNSALREFYNVENSDASPAIKDAAAMKFYNSIKDMRLQSKNKKLAL